MSKERKALEWLLGDDTGVSSKSLCAHMLGLKKTDTFGMGAPSDGADRGRCIRLLNKIPEWWDRLDEMAEYPSEKYIAVTAKGVESREDGWAEQIPLIRQEANRLPEALPNPTTPGGDKTPDATPNSERES